MDLGVLSDLYYLSSKLDRDPQYLRDSGGLFICKPGRSDGPPPTAAIRIRQAPCADPVSLCPLPLAWAA